MKAYLDCYPCFLRQALSASRRGGADPEQQMAVIRRSLALLENLEPEATPPQIAHRVHGIVREEIGAADPYRQANYETLSESEPKVFCLLQIKCPVIARDIGAPVGGIAVLQARSRS